MEGHLGRWQAGLNLESQIGRLIGSQAMLGSVMPGVEWQAFSKATEQRRGKIRLCALWQLAV